MHDKKSADPEVQRLRQRLDELEQQVKQLARVRQPKITLPPHGPLLCEANESIAQGDEAEVEILVFDEDDGEIGLSGETFNAQEVLMEDGDTAIEEGTKLIVQWIDGKSCITGIWNQGLKVHRGVTTEDIDKGDAGGVSRYDDGTNTPSGIVDTVQNDYIDIGTSKNVMYIELAGTNYLFAVECPPT